MHTSFGCVIPIYHTTKALDKRGFLVHNLDMKPVKTMSIRLTTEQAEALEIVASIEALPLSEVIRTAISEHIDSKTKDPVFQDSLKERLDRAQRLLGNRE